MSIYILTRMRFVIPLILSFLLIASLFVGYKTLEHFFKLSYVGYVTTLPKEEHIRAGLGGYIKTIHVSPGSRITTEDSLFDIVVTGPQPPDQDLIDQLFRLRTINARLESQQGGLRKILLSPDLRNRAKLDPKFNAFLEEEKALFRAFHALLAIETQKERQKNERIKNQVELIATQLKNLRAQKKDFSNLYNQLTIQNNPGQLQTIKNDIVVLDKDIQRYVDSHQKLKNNQAKASLALINKTLSVRNSVRSDFEKARADMNTLFDLLDVEGRNESEAETVTSRRTGILSNIRTTIPGQSVAPRQVIASLIDENEYISVKVHVGENKASHYQVRDIIPVIFPDKQKSMYIEGKLIEISSHPTNQGIYVFVILLPVQDIVREYGRLPKKNLIVGTMLERGESREENFFTSTLYQRIKFLMPLKPDSISYFF